MAPRPNGAGDDPLDRSAWFDQRDTHMRSATSAYTFTSLRFGSLALFNDLAQRRPRRVPWAPLVRDRSYWLR
jgi:hypothetical protein